MNKIRKLLIPALFLCLTLSGMTVMESSAEETQGEQASAGSALEDENPQRLEEVTGMDEEGNIYEVDDSEGTVEQPKLRTFSRAANVQVVNFRTKGNATTNYTEYGTGASGYTNGAYGADAAYLGTYNGKVRFMLSGVVGEVQPVKYSWLISPVQSPSAAMKCLAADFCTTLHRICRQRDTQLLLTTEMLHHIWQVAPLITVMTGIIFIQIMQ